MIRLRGLQTWLIVSALIAGTLLPGLAVARPGFNLGDWSFVLTYEIDNNWDITYTESGDFTHLINCAGTWDLVSEETGPTTSSKHLHEFAMDYLTGEFGFIHIEDGTKTKRVSACSLFTLDALPTKTLEWVWWTECSGTTWGQTNIWEVNKEKAFPNSDLEISIHESFTNEADDDGVCYRVRASGPDHDVPYTGTFNTGQGGQESGGPGGVFNHNDVQVIGIEEGAMVGGYTAINPVEHSASYTVNKCPELVGNCSWAATATAGEYLFGALVGSAVGHLDVKVRAVD